MVDICVEYLKGLCDNAKCPKLHAKSRSNAIAEITAKKGLLLVCDSYFHGRCELKSCPLLHVRSINADYVGRPDLTRVESFCRTPYPHQTQKTFPKSKNRKQQHPAAELQPSAGRFTSQIRGKLRDLNNAEKMHQCLYKNTNSDESAEIALHIGYDMEYYTFILQGICIELDRSIQNLYISSPTG